jgi:4-hydroxy-tetrahydrodipicolinate reductase
VSGVAVATPPGGQVIHVAVLGASGRMGRAILAEVFANPDMRLVGALEVPGSPALGVDAGLLVGQHTVGVAVTDNVAAVLPQAHVVIDFTSPLASLALAVQAAEAGCALMVGTTGFTPSQRAAVEAASARVPVIIAANTSVGVNLLLSVIRQISTVLDDSYDIEVVEAHHRNKKDAPSGTALALAGAAAKGRGVDLTTVAVYGREGIVGARPRGEIGIHTVRGGDVVGDHTVLFACEGERIEVTHKASSRQTFAKGAVRGARFLAGREPGLYTMADVLGLPKQ